MSPKERSQPASVQEWMTQELARDAQLRQEVEEELNRLRIQQDLAALRERRQLSQHQLARLLGVSQPVVAKIETGTSKNMGLRTLVRVALVLGARVRLVLELQDDAPPRGQLGLVSRPRKMAKTS